MKSFDTPILFLVFNRPKTTRIVFESIRKIAPAFLYVAADGARNGVPGEAERCLEVKNILSNIDWKCEIKTLYREKNLGCGLAVSSGISWFFENVEEGIILEDDCLPNKSFFEFSQRMLAQFRNNEKVMHIGGNNFQLSRIGEECFYFSKLPHIWGWATWRRAWKAYDFTLSNFNKSQEHSFFKDKMIDDFWKKIWIDTKEKLETWDYQWTFAVLSNKGYCILPQNNLVSNLGFQQDSTHTADSGNYLNDLKTYEMEVYVKDSNINYNPVVDLNFHYFFSWVVRPVKLEEITAKSAGKIIIKKLKMKLYNEQRSPARGINKNN